MVVATNSRILKLIRVMESRLAVSREHECFVTKAVHVENFCTTILHTAQVHCVALQNEHGFTKSLGILAVQLTNTQWQMVQEVSGTEKSKT